MITFGDVWLSWVAHFWNEMTICLMNLFYHLILKKGSILDLTCWPACLVSWKKFIGCLLWQKMIKIIVNFGSYKLSLICTYNLFFSYINNIINRIFIKYFDLDLLKIISIIKIGLIMLKKCNNKADQKYLRLIN